MEFQTPRGTRDFLPEDMVKRNYVLTTIKFIFEKWGFDPMNTPAFEEWELLSAKSGQEIKNEIYYFKDKSDRELGLRFDLTVPFARVVVNNPQLPKPFKRYQIGQVWRYDRPGAGRYREFSQADIDIAGAPVGEADALCIAVVCSALKKLELTDFSVRINNRKIIEAFLVSIGLKDDVKNVLRSIDKLDKIGEEGVTKELREKKIDNDKINKILRFIKIKTLKDAKDLVGNTELGKQGIDELEKILEYLQDLGFSEFVNYDSNLVRGLEYYTGPVFEINAGLDISIGGGGRYDNLIENFGGKITPATGISIGIDRLLLAMEKITNKMPKTNTRILVISVGDTKKECVNITKEFIEMGIPSEFDLMQRSISKQLDYANSKGIPFVMVVGEKELSSRKANLRDMLSGQEYEIHLQGLQDVKKYLTEHK